MTQGDGKRVCGQLVDMIVFSIALISHYRLYTTLSHMLIAVVSMWIGELHITKWQITSWVCCGLKLKFIVTYHQFRDDKERASVCVCAYSTRGVYWTWPSDHIERHIHHIHIDECNICWCKCIRVNTFAASHRILCKRTYVSPESNVDVAWRTLIIISFSLLLLLLLFFVCTCINALWIV